MNALKSALVCVRDELCGTRFRKPMDDVLKDLALLEDPPIPSVIYVDGEAPSASIRASSAETLVGLTFVDEPELATSLRSSESLSISTSGSSTGPREDVPAAPTPLLRPRPLQLTSAFLASHYAHEQQEPSSSVEQNGSVVSMETQTNVASSTMSQQSAVRHLRTWRLLQRRREYIKCSSSSSTPPTNDDGSSYSTCYCVTPSRLIQRNNSGLLVTP